MAGIGKRFRDAGFQADKYMLYAKGKPIFDWAVLSLRKFFCNEFIFICRQGAESFIRERSRILGIRKLKIVSLDQATDGQATTVFEGLLSLSSIEAEKEGILIYNIDTHISPDILSAEDIPTGADGWILLFRAPGEHWSFARTAKDGRVLEVREKVRISEMATAGLYYFSSFSVFSRYYKKHRGNIKREYGEVYVAPIYQYMIKEGLNISSKTISFRDVVPLGKPEEVLRFDRQFFSKHGKR